MTPSTEPTTGSSGPWARSWDRARWVNEVRRFDTTFDVDAPRSGGVRTRSRGLAEAAPVPTAPPVLAFEHVTLVVHEWQNAEPGTLSWQFPDVSSAVTAARAMRNAVRWAVVGGTDQNVNRARELGLVLAEADAPLLPSKLLAKV